MASKAIILDNKAKMYASATPFSVSHGLRMVQTAKVEDKMDMQPNGANAQAPTNGRMNSSESNGRDRVQTGQLERAFDVIKALTNSLQPLKLSALSEVTRLDPSGTLRLLKTLIDLGYVTRDDATKSYLPSARALFPLTLFHPFQELRRDAADLLFAIQRDTGATSAVQVFLGGERVVLEQRAGSNRLTPYVDPIVRSPHHASASGKLLLSSLTPEERASLVGPGPFQRLTRYTLTTPEQLEAEIHRSNQRGFFSVQEEAMVGMSSIAAALTSASGQVIGCMVAFGTSMQLPEDLMTERGEAVKRAADMLSRMSPALRALEPMLCRTSKAGSGTADRNQQAEPAELETPAFAAPAKAKPKAARKVQR